MTNRIQGSKETRDKQYQEWLKKRNVNGRNKFRRMLIEEMDKLEMQEMQESGEAEERRGGL